METNRPMELEEPGYFRKVFEICPDGLFVVDGNGVIQEMNRAMEAMTGWTREELVGKEQCLLLFACRRHEGGAICETTCPGRSVLTHPASTPQVALQIRTKEGKEIVVSTRYAFLPADPGSSSGWTLGIMREIPKTAPENHEIPIPAITDGPTGLYSFRYFFYRLRKEIKRTIRRREPLSLLKIEIDDLDDRRPQQSETAVKGVATLLHGGVRETDLAATYGDAFVVLLPNTEKQSAIEVAERLRSAAWEICAAGSPPVPGKNPSIRIAVVSYPWDAEEPEGLLWRAGILLQKSKGRGKNKIFWRRL